MMLISSLAYIGQIIIITLICLLILNDRITSINRQQKQKNKRLQNNRKFAYVKLAKQNPEIMPPLPYRSTAKSAGYDVFAPFTITLQPNEEAKIPTFIKAYMNDGEVLKAYPRSGLGFKYYCRLANTVGIIDSDYADNEANEGHIFIKLRNEGDEPMTINKGEAMCQFIFEKFLLVAGDNFNKGNKRIGGFGSTTSQKD